MWRIERDVRECEAENFEDAPDWEFDNGETKSKDPTYIFCPATHRAMILRLFTQHFCWHPIFPSRLGRTQSAIEIRRQAVREMYQYTTMAALGPISQATAFSTPYNNDSGEPLEAAQTPSFALSSSSTPRPYHLRDLYQGHPCLCASSRGTVRCTLIRSGTAINNVPEGI